MKNILKIFDVKIFIYAFITWLSLNISGIQKIYFFRDVATVTIIVKGIHLIFLYVIFKKINSLFVNRKIPKVKNEIVIALIYFLILTILLILTWPGAWSNDDITILRNAEKYNLTPWHHFFSGLFQILCLQTIPIPAGVIIIQILISSLIIGYCISNIALLYGKNLKQIRILQIILGLISVFPPLILYILSGFRMGLYSYLELLLVTKMIILYKERKTLDFGELIKISLLTIIVSCWRTEAFYYPVCILILFLILGKKVIRRKVSICVFIAMMLINFSIGKLNNFMIGTNNYSITATILGVTTLVEHSGYETDKEELAEINKVVDVEFIKEHPDIPPEVVFWAEDVVKDYTEEEYSNYLKAYIKLALKYADIVFKGFWDMFAKACGGVGEDSKQTTYNMVHNGHSTAVQLFKFATQGWKEWRGVTSRVLKYNGPINEELRESVILFLNGSQENKEVTVIHNIFWNLFIPLILILICLIHKLTKKHWFMVILILTVIARVPLVFVTAPAPYFMYYLSTYVCSYFIATIVIFEMITKKREKRENNLFNGKTFLYTFLIWLNLNISGIQNIYFSQENVMTVIIKILHLVFLYIIFDKIRLLYQKRHMSKVKNEIIISVAYFLILISLTLLVWPGVWSVDDITILRDASTYEFTQGENIFSGIFQMLCLQTIPIPSGVMIVQALIAALIVGDCISNISTLYGKNRKQVLIIQIVLGLIMLFPPLLIYILSGFKMGICTYLELALITKMLILYKEKKEATFNDVFKISFLTVIISCWKPGGWYYPFLILLLYFILGKKVIRKKVAITVFLIIMLINCLMGTINYLTIGLENMNISTDENALDLYTVGTKSWMKWNSVTSIVSKYKVPINMELRYSVITFLSEKNVFWNLYIPFGLIFISLVYKLIKKDWFMSMLIGAVIVSILIVSTTVSTEYFVYYLSTYLCSYIISFIVIFEVINNLINKKNKNNQEKIELVVYKGIFKQFLSFLLVSGVGWIIDFSIYFTLTRFANFKVVFANILSSIPAITYVFLMSNQKIFKNADSKLSLKTKYLIYFGYQLLLLLSISLLGEFLYEQIINLVTVEFLLNNLKIFIKILITPITMTLNFIVMKNLIEKL